MGKVHVVFILISSSMLLIANAQSLFQGSEKKANFRIYIQDFEGGPNATAYDVARASITSTSPTSFGRVVVVDDLMTAKPYTNSKKLGRAQGFITSSGLEEAALTININLVFTVGKYKGSTLIVMGWKLSQEPNQELLIAGGTGVFRWARGYTITKTYFNYTSTGYGVLEYDLYVVYPKQQFRFGVLANK